MAVTALTTSWLGFDPATDKVMFWDGVRFRQLIEAAGVAPAIHSHAIDDVDGLAVALASKLDQSDAEIQNAALIGLGTTADPANPFAAKINKALWTARYAAEGGDGNLFYTMNKEDAGRDVGFLLQTNFVTKALLGLFGSDNFRLSVSNNGSSFKDAIIVDRTTGIVALSSNPKFVGHINFDQYIAANTWTKVSINNTSYNDQNAFDAGGNYFMAPAAGLYTFGATLGWKQNGTNVPTVTKARLVKNGSIALCAPLVSRPLSGVATNGTEVVLHLHVMTLLAAGDTVELQQIFTTLDGYIPLTHTTFCGVRVA